MKVQVKIKDEEGRGRLHGRENISPTHNKPERPGKH